MESVMHLRMLAITGVLVAGLAAPLSTAQAAPSRGLTPHSGRFDARPLPTTAAAVQAELNDVLAGDPTAKQLNSYEVALNGGKVIYSVPVPGSRRSSSQRTPTATPLSVNDCPNDWLCLWQGTNYSLRLIRFTNIGYLQDIRPYFTNVNSYYDNRGQRAFLHYDLNASGTEVCVSAYQRNSATAPWINSHTYAVYLANSSGC